MLLLLWIKADLDSFLRVVGGGESGKNASSQLKSLISRHCHRRNFKDRIVFYGGVGKLLALFAIWPSASVYGYCIAYGCCMEKMT